MKPSKFDAFFAHRQSLIDQYTKGDLTKEEFIERNYDYIVSMNTNPFKRIDNLKKSLFNYQYYNVLAKYWQKRAHEVSRNSLQKQDYLQKANYFYSKKDHVTLKTLEILDFQGVEAYYVKIKSSNLKNQLFEILLEDDEHIIMHSKNPHIRDRLVEEGVFKDTIQKSLIDSYINQKY